MFVLDKKLAEDSFFALELNICKVQVMDNVNFPWLILIPKIANVSEVFDLKEKDRQKVWQEINEVAKALKEGFEADKINIATFGNKVKQLHFHVIARFNDDLAWPNTAWSVDAKKYHPQAKNIMVDRIKEILENI
jgi:diadenosine tetraphosphate (Ap4A) HIT family hydrolase